MSIKDIAQLIGSEMFQRGKGICYPVVVKDFRIRYGTIDALIIPIGGKGEQWVEFASLLGKDQV